MESTIVDIGLFDVSSGKLIVSDPCYTQTIHDTAAAHIPAENGKWMAVTERANFDGWGNRITKLMVWHTSISSTSELLLEELRQGGSVDSGQLGIFCSSIYPEGRETGEYGELDTFYGQCCASTYKRSLDLKSDELSAGIIQNAGVCASSGFGDGGYPIEVAYRNGVAIAVIVTFIGENDTDEDDFYEDEDGYEDGYEDLNDYEDQSEDEDEDEGNLIN